MRSVRTGDLGDPALARFSMPLHEIYFPLGFPLRIETNCEEVLNCAAASWKGFVKLFDTPPMKLRIGVRNGHSSDCPPAPACKIQQHLVSNIADSENFSVVDLSGICFNMADEGGGRQSQLFALFLPRIRCALPSCYFAHDGDSCGMR